MQMCGRRSKTMSKLPHIDGRERDEVPDELEVVVCRSDVQRGVAGDSVGEVDVGAVSNQVPDHLEVAAKDEHVEQRVALGGGGGGGG